MEENYLELITGAYYDATTGIAYLNYHIESLKDELDRIVRAKENIIEEVQKLNKKYENNEISHEEYEAKYTELDWLFDAVKLWYESLSFEYPRLYKKVKQSSNK